MLLPAMLPRTVGVERSVANRRILVFVMMIGLYAREKCRLGCVHWSICTMMGMPIVGVPISGA